MASTLSPLFPVGRPLSMLTFHIFSVSLMCSNYKCLSSCSSFPVVPKPGMMLLVCFEDQFLSTLGMIWLTSWSDLLSAHILCTEIAFMAQAHQLAPAILRDTEVWGRTLDSKTVLWTVARASQPVDTWYWGHSWWLESLNWHIHYHRIYSILNTLQLQQFGTPHMCSD